MNPADRLRGWTPFRIAFRGRDLWVDWCHLGARRMIEPFFYETITQAMREPFNLVFQQRTPIEVLAGLPEGVPPAGFIFHMSRCGSTLVSQALAAIERNIVVAEAVPLRMALRVASGRAGAARAKTWLTGLVNAYAQPRFAGEDRLIVKFMAADVLDIALIRDAFPHVPWIFVTRDPAEILGSQAASAGIDLMRGQLAAARLGLDEAALWRMDRIAYQAHALAAFARAGLAAHRPGQSLILDHSELPEALWTTVPEHFGLCADPGTIERMRAVSRRHSKRPSDVFSSEHDAGRVGAAAFRSVSAPITEAAMTALARLRQAT